MTSASLPIVGITLGDPAGIGPEVVGRALLRAEVRAACRPLVIGDARVFADRRLVPHGPPVAATLDTRTIDFRSDAVALLDLRNLRPAEAIPGRLSAACGRASAEQVQRGAKLALAGDIDALATAPVNKEAWRLAGVPFVGHTEMLAAIAAAGEVTTMLATPGLRVTHVTRHVPFARIAGELTVERILATIRLTDAGLRGLGVSPPRLAVAGLNPHNGDGGLLGTEERDIIAPAVAAARGGGIDVEGPVPADSVFAAALRGAYDAVVCLYHDQGHIPVKTHNLDESITVTLGLPFVRTSADHGTAFDIAGRGIARESSMAAAILEAAAIARRAGGVGRP